MHVPDTTPSARADASYGGFMGLEPLGDPRPLPYATGSLLSSGRACMAFILDRERPRRAYVPFYTCQSLLDPFEERGVEVLYYHVDDDLLPVGISAPAADELLVLIDYFGVRTHAVRELALELGQRTVIDLTHAFFSGPPPAGHYGFNSARKFRGVPDGAFLFLKDGSLVDLPSNTTMTGDHLILRMMGSGEEVVQANKMNEARINTALLGAAPLSRALLHRLDHTGAQQKRDRNFAAAHAVLGDFNQLRVDDPGMKGPLCYPLLRMGPVDLKPMHSAGIFAARYWPDILSRSGRELFPDDVLRTQRLIAFPIDQRYSPEETSERAWQLTRML
jgi:hypothetical protein